MKSHLTSISALAALCLSMPAGAQTVFTVSSWAPATVPHSIAQRQWCDLLSKTTAGKMKCNILPRGVANPASTYDAIKDGLADISFFVHGYTPGRFVLTQVVEFPFLGESAKTMSTAFTRIASRHKEFADEHRDVHVLAYFTDAPGMLMNTKKEVKGIDDLRSLKWRVSGGVVNEVAQALGMNATLKPATEVYELLAGGVMDGTLFPADALVPWKIDKLIKYATTFPGGFYNTSFAFIMNKKKYEALNSEEKAAIDAISGETAAGLFGEAWDIAEKNGLDLMKRNGTTITNADPRFLADITEAIKPVEAHWMARAKEKGVMDPARLLSEFKAEVRQ